MSNRVLAASLALDEPQGCRTLCQHPGCGKPIFERRTGPTWYWVHVDPDFDREHPATPVERPEHPGEPATPGEALRWYARRENVGDSPEGRAWAAKLRGWADESDAGQPEPLTLPREVFTDPERLVDELTHLAAARGLVPDERESTRPALLLTARTLVQILLPAQPPDAELDADTAAALEAVADGGEPA